MTASKARIKANARYNAKTYEQIKFQSRKENRLRELIAIAADKRGISSAQYIVEAVQVQFNTDGITPDMLPEVEPDQEETENT